MFYILLILPHIAVIGGMLWFAFRTEPGPPSTGWDDGPGNDPAPMPPDPRLGPSSGPPLGDAEQPRPRLRPGENLTDRTVPPPRRDRHPVPERAPAETP